MKSQTCSRRREEAENRNIGPPPHVGGYTSGVIGVILLATVSISHAAAVGGKPLPKVPAFPGAEGAGAITPGGRGGKVYEVTTLADGGPGSLREAFAATEPRIVVFRVSGIITLTNRLPIDHPFITVAGQTAPGDGICVRGETTEINTHDVTMRYMRFQRGSRSQQPRLRRYVGWPLRLFSP